MQHKVKLNLPKRHAKLAIPAAEAPIASDEEISSVEEQLEKKGLVPDIYEERKQGVWLNLRTELKEAVSGAREASSQVAVVESEHPASIMDVVMGEMNTESYKIPPLEHLHWLEQEEREKLHRVLWFHREGFQKSKNEMGCTDLIQHEIESVEGAVPHKKPSRRLSP